VDYVGDVYPFNRAVQGFRKAESGQYILYIFSVHAK
jgi:hypothetical protein